MEIRIGVQNVAREITFESAQSPEEVAAAVDAALSGGRTLSLTDEKGRRILVVAEKLAYLEIGAVESRRVGFSD